MRHWTTQRTRSQHTQNNIIKGQQRSLAQDNETVASLESRLTKGDIAPRQVDLSVVSAMTGENRESKAKACVAEESKKVPAQYGGTIAGSKVKFKKEIQVESLQSKLDIVLKALVDATSKFNVGSQAKE